MHAHTPTQSMSRHVADHAARPGPMLICRLFAPFDIPRPTPPRC